MPNSNWYIDWFDSPYYDQLYKNRDDAEAFSLIDTVINHLMPPANSRVLDVACGKGRHSKALADKGFDVTGIDISFEQVMAASLLQKEYLRFYQHDMRLPFWINYYDYAFNMFTSFGYFRTQREHDNAIRTIATSLKPNGLFVMDYLNVHFEEANLLKAEVKQYNDTTFYLAKWHDDDFFYKQIQVQEKLMALKHLYTERVAKFTLGIFTEMFAYQGLQIKEVFGDYMLGHYDINKSPRLIMIAKKVGF